MVPSDPSDSPSPDRHARSRLGIRNGVTCALLLPAAVFTRLRIEAPVRVRSSVPVEARFSMRPFAHRQRPLSLRLSRRGRVNVPDLHLRCDSAISALPVRLRAPAPSPGRLSPEPGRSQRSKPVARSNYGTPHLDAELSLPFRTFQSLGIVALCPFPDGEACLCELPDFPSLPGCAKIIAYLPCAPGSTFRLRYFPPGLLSLEPLGTTLIMHPNSVSVK